MRRAEWTNALPNFGSGLGVQRDFGVITDYFPLSDGSYETPPEGFYTTQKTWYDAYLERRRREFIRARNATPYGSAENARLWEYICHIHGIQFKRRWESDTPQVWVEWHTFKHYPSYEAWQAEKKAQEAEAERKAIPVLFAEKLEGSRRYYNNSVYSQLYTPEEREALALKEAGEVTARRIAEFEQEYNQQYNRMNN